MTPKVLQTTMASIAVLIGLPIIFSTASKDRPAPVVQQLRGEWLKFGTNPCGELAGVESRQSVPRKARAVSESTDPDGDEDEEDRWANAWGMSDDESAWANQWITEHKALAIITDAVDKTCRARDPPGEDDTTEVV